MIHTETVHPSQLRRAMASYAAQGYPPAYGPHPFQQGMMVIVITVPDGAVIPDWETDVPRPRRRWFRFNLRRLAMWACVLVIAGSLAYIAYSMFVDSAAPVAPVAPAPSLWDSIMGTLPHGEPAVERTAPAVEMPWDTAGKQVGAAIDGINRALTMVFTLLALGAVAWFVLKVRGMVRK